MSEFVETPEETTIREALNAEWSWSMGTRTRADALAALDALVEKLRAATNMLAEAERFVPGVIQTAGRLALFGTSDREKLEAAEARVAALEAREATLTEVVNAARDYVGEETIALIAERDAQPRSFIGVLADPTWRRLVEALAAAAEPSGEAGP